MKLALNEEFINNNNLPINETTSYSIEKTIQERWNECYLQMNLLYSLLSETKNNPHDSDIKIQIIKELLESINEDHGDTKEISEIKKMPLESMDDVLTMAPVAYRVYIGMDRKHL